MAFDKNKLPSWVNFQTIHNVMAIVGPTLSVIAILVGAFYGVSAYVERTNQTATAVATLSDKLDKAVDKIEAKIDGLPVDQFRLQQVEERERQEAGEIDTLDGRMNLVERKTDATTATLDAMRGGTSSRLR